jgi:hypothetical protein
MLHKPSYACLMPASEAESVPSMRLLHENLRHLVLSWSTLGELKANTTTSQSSVNFRVGIKSVVNTSLLLLIENNLKDLASILLGAKTLANNLNWVDEIGQDGVVDSGQCSGTRTLLSLGSARAVGALWAWQDTARREDQDMAVGELLLKLTGEAVMAVYQIG